MSAGEQEKPGSRENPAVPRLALGEQTETTGNDAASDGTQSGSHSRLPSWVTDTLLGERLLERAAATAFDALAEPWRSPSPGALRAPMLALLAAASSDLGERARKDGSPRSQPGSFFSGRSGKAAGSARLLRWVQLQLADSVLADVLAGAALACLPARWPHPSSSSTLLEPVRAALNRLVQQLEERVA